MKQTACFTSTQAAHQSPQRDINRSNSLQSLSLNSRESVSDQVFRYCLRSNKMEILDQIVEKAKRYKNIREQEKAALRRKELYQRTQKQLNNKQLTPLTEEQANSKNSALSNTIQSSTSKLSYKRKNNQQNRTTISSLQKEGDNESDNSQSKSAKQSRRAKGIGFKSRQNHQISNKSVLQTKEARSPISKPSQTKIMTSTSNFSNDQIKYDDMMADWKMKQNLLLIKQKEQLNRQCTFSPVISEKSREISASRKRRQQHGQQAQQIQSQTQEEYISRYKVNSAYTNYEQKQQQVQPNSEVAGKMKKSIDRLTKQMDDKIQQCFHDLWSVLHTEPDKKTLNQIQINFSQRSPDLLEFASYLFSKIGQTEARCINFMEFHQSFLIFQKNLNRKLELNNLGQVSSIQEKTTDSKSPVRKNIYQRVLNKQKLKSQNTNTPSNKSRADFNKRAEKQSPSNSQSRSQSKIRKEEEFYHKLLSQQTIQEQREFSIEQNKSKMVYISNKYKNILHPIKTDQNIKPLQLKTLL